MQMISSAKDYLYITTPYLIIDDSMLSALTLAAKSGVDVRIITPNRYDKFWVHFTTRSYYKRLLRSGVKIYEYTPGFMHSKTVVCDGRAATVGTTNFDFRSFYFHFECGVWMYDCAAVASVEKDFLCTLKKCKQINESDCKKNIFVRTLQAILRVFAPLM
jgi:cardiolipin synthase